MEKLRAVGGQASDSIGIEGRVPPHDLDAEAAVLSAVMIDPLAFDKVNEFLKPEHFYSEAHRRIYEACVELSADGQAGRRRAGRDLAARSRAPRAGRRDGLPDRGPQRRAGGRERGRRTRKTIHEKWRVRQLILACQRVDARRATRGTARRSSSSTRPSRPSTTSPAPASRRAVFPLRDVMQETFRRMTKANAAGRAHHGHRRPASTATIGSRAASTTAS